MTFPSLGGGGVVLSRVVMVILCRGEGGAVQGVGGGPVQGAGSPVWGQVVPSRRQVVLSRGRGEVVLSREGGDIHHHPPACDHVTYPMMHLVSPPPPNKTE